MSANPNVEKEFREVLDVYITARHELTKTSTLIDYEEETKPYQKEKDFLDALSRVETAVAANVINTKATLGARRKASVVYNWMLSFDKARSCYRTSRIREQACSAKLADNMTSAKGYMRTHYANLVGDVSE